MTDENPRALENSQDYVTTEINNLALSEIPSQELERVHPYHRDPRYRPWLRPAGPKNLLPMKRSKP
jgi:hypothetical protein